MSILYFPIEEEKVSRTLAHVSSRRPSPEEISYPVTPKVLSIDNSRICQKVNETILKKLGCLVELAETAKEALEKIKMPYEIIFLEACLPNFKGELIVDLIRCHEQSLNRNTPIVIISSWFELNFRKQYFARGVDAVFTKPLLLQDFKKILQHFSVIL